MADQAVQAARFVAERCGCTDAQLTASTSGQVQLTTGGSTLVGLSTVCKHLAAQHPHLLGSSAEAQAQISEWLTWATTELTPLMDDKLVKVNEHLQSRTYLVGASATLADLVVYALVHPAVGAFPVAQTLHFCNLLRWYDLLQHTVDVSAFFPRIAVDKPRFQPPPPPAPAPAKAAPAPASSSAAPAAPSAPSAAPAKADKAAAKDAAPVAAAPPPKADGAAAAPAGGKDKGGKDKGAKEGAGKEKEKKAAAEPAAKKEEEEARIDMLDIRVGRIVEVDKHPNADALYLEKIDLGEPSGPRQVISGLVNFVPREAMQDRVVLVVCNLKPAKMRDVMSYGMVLCASDEAHSKVEPVVVPEGVPIGERVTVEGFNAAPIDEVNPKKKILERLFPDMKTDAAGVPVYKGVPFTTSKGPMSSSIPNGWVK